MMIQIKFIFYIVYLLGIFAIDKELLSSENYFHKKCLQAEDYRGCIKVNKKTNQEIFDNKNDDCGPNINAVDNWCFAGEGTDLLGEQKIKGWLYKELPSKKANMYVDLQMRQLNVNGAYGKYLIGKSILRTYREFIADRPMREKIVGDSKTTCNQFGRGFGDVFGNPSYSSFNFSGTMFCKTSPPRTSLIPGQKGQTEGINQDVIESIYDCDAKEYSYKYTTFETSKLSKWQPILKWIQPHIVASCRDYMLLPKSNSSEYSESKLRPSD